MASYYIRQLQKSLDAPPDTATPAMPDLRQRLIEWFKSQPEVTRNRRYSMVELERALGTQGRFLSPVLLSLGWERHRKWSSRGQNPRYWIPPAELLQRSPG